MRGTRGTNVQKIRSISTSRIRKLGRLRIWRTRHRMWKQRYYGGDGGGGAEKKTKRLPERQRMAVLMHKYQQMDYRQIAEVLKLSESATKSLLFRAYESLRTELKE